MSALTTPEKREKLIAWVKKKNERAKPREKDWQELWIEIEPYFIQCEGDNEFKFELICLATNYR